MKVDHSITTRFSTECDVETSHLERLSGMINQAYDDGELGMWQHAGMRTNPAEVEHLIRVGSLIVAESGDKLVGSVSVTLMGDGIGGFGMLVADSGHRAAGVGSALVGRAEDWARNAGCHTMQLELLTPRRWRHPSKEFLKRWYSSIGYRPQATKPFEEIYPKLAPLLAADCDFTVWQKPLA